MAAEAATERVLGSHRNPKLSSRLNLVSDQKKYGPKKMEEIPFAFSLCFPTLGPESSGHQRKYTAEQVTKATAFWSEDDKKRGPEEFLLWPSGLRI